MTSNPCSFATLASKAGSWSTPVGLERTRLLPFTTGEESDVDMRRTVTSPLIDGAEPTTFSRMKSPLSPNVRAELEPSAAAIARALDGRTVALAQEWIGSRAGSEKVFEALACLMRDAELFTLTRAPGVAIETDGRAITTSSSIGHCSVNVVH